MELKTIAIFCLCDDILKVLGIVDDPQSKMSSSEVMTVALVAAYLFHGNHSRTRLFLQIGRFFPNMLSKSRLNRRLHAIDSEVWKTVLAFFCEYFKQCNVTQEYIVDSFPVAVCQNCRISRSKIYEGREYHGYCASKKSYVYGLKVHIVTSRNGFPVEVLFTPGSEADIKAFRRFHLDLPQGAKIYADRAYTDYGYEDLLLEAGSIRLVAHRKSNSTRPLIGPLKYLQATSRKRIETTFSQITEMFPRTIRAVNRKGFELKLLCFILTSCFLSVL